MKKEFRAPDTPHLVPLFCAILPCLVWVLNGGLLDQLIWFGDELFLLQEVSHLGVESWFVHPFAENFVPLFKILWLGVVDVSNGDYYWMITGLWLTHACNVWMVSYLLTRWGIGSGIPLIAGMTLFAVAPSMIESLGWGVQWSALLAATFFLLGLLVVETCRGPWGVVLFGLCGFASAVCFSRGVIWAGLLAAVPWVRSVGSSGRERCVWSVAPIVAAGAVALVIVTSSSGNHVRVGSLEIIRYLGWLLFFVCGNPLSSLITTYPPEGSWVLLYGIPKYVVIGAALLFVRDMPRARLLLLWLLCADIVNGAIVSLGRLHTDPRFAISSRYQYESLMLFVPFVVVVLQHIASEVRWAYHSAVGVLCLWCVVACVRWRVVLEEWVEWRGTPGRLLLLSDTSFSEEEAHRWLGLPPFMTLNEAREVVESHNLH